jgi:predicted ribonuclease YlaK
LKHGIEEIILVLAGSAGTGKTFLALFMAFEEVLEPDTDYDQVVVIRSMVPTRDMGFLPGTMEEKQDAYTAPYRLSVRNYLVILRHIIKLLQLRKLDLNLHHLFVV